MAEVVQQNTGYGVFVQACWAQHERQYPDHLIHKEIEEFNKQCSVWWYSLTEEDRNRFEEVADKSNKAQLEAINPTYTVEQPQDNNVVQAQFSTSKVMNSVPGTSSGYSYTNYDMHEGQQGQVIHAGAGSVGHAPQHTTETRPQQNSIRDNFGGTGQFTRVNQKSIKDPNAPKKPLSAYFLFSQAERLKVKGENPEFSVIDVAKEIGRRWATVDPLLKATYEKKYQEAKELYDIEMGPYKTQKKKKDPKAPKQPMSAYFIFSAEQRSKVKDENPSLSFTEIAKELGRRWGDLNPSEKQKYQARADQERVKYENNMNSYRQITNTQGQYQPKQTSLSNKVVHHGHGYGLPL